MLHTLLSAYEESIFTWFSAIAVLIGATFVAITPRNLPVIVSVLVGAPIASAIFFALVMFVLGLFPVRAGGGPLTALAAGLFTGVFYGLGTAILGAPAAVLGGCIGAIIRHYRFREHSGRR